MQAHRNLGILLFVDFFEATSSLPSFYSLFDDPSINASPVVVKWLVKVSVAMSGVAYIPMSVVWVSTVWMIMWYVPTFMCISIDNLGTKLYAPMTSSEDWAMAHRSLQVLNAVSLATGSRAEDTPFYLSSPCPS